MAGKSRKSGANISFVKGKGLFHEQHFEKQHQGKISRFMYACLKKQTLEKKLYIQALHATTSNFGDWRYKEASIFTHMGTIIKQHIKACDLFGKYESFLSGLDQFI